MRDAAGEAPQPVHLLRLEELLLQPLAARDVLEGAKDTGDGALAEPGTTGHPHVQLGAAVRAELQLQVSGPLGPRPVQGGQGRSRPGEG